MKRLLLITLIFVPQAVFALTMEERVELRKQQRMAQDHSVEPTWPSMRRAHRNTEGVVTQVVDGSVLVVKLPTGRLLHVRTLGSEAPLIGAGSTKDQCYAEQSRLALAAKALGKTVRLERDENYQYDNHRRLLRYVYLHSLDVNSWMLSNGHSFTDAKNTHRKSSLYNSLQQEARDDNLGLWNDFCTYNPTPKRVIEVEQQ